MRLKGECDFYHWRLMVVVVDWCERWELLCACGIVYRDKSENVSFCSRYVFFLVWECMHVMVKCLRSGCMSKEGRGPFFFFAWGLEWRKGCNCQSTFGHICRMNHWNRVGFFGMACEWWCHMRELHGFLSLMGITTMPLSFFSPATHPRLCLMFFFTVAVNL